MIEIKNKLNNEEFSYYIAGLWEGDGHLVCISKKTKYFTFCITFSKNDEILANYVLSFIGYGYLRYKIKENAIVLTIGNKKGLLNIINILNGKLRTPKLYKFNLLIDWINSLDLGQIIIKYNEDNSNIFNNAWFAGFTEADGCFDIRLTQAKKKSRVAFRYRLDQRMYDPLTNYSYENCLLNISNTFKSKLKILIKKNNSYYHISITKYESLELLISYFSKFNLFGIKYLNYLDWFKAYNIYINRTRITPELIIELKKIKNQMNSQRLNFKILINSMK